MRQTSRRLDFAQKKMRFEELEDRRLLATIFATSLDTNPGWTTTGQWAFGHPTGQGGASHGNADPGSGYTGDNVYGVNLNGDYNTSITGTFYLTTTAIQCTNYSNVVLSFRRWLNTDCRPYVSATVEVSNNGTNWAGIYANPGNNTPVTDSSWQDLEYDIGAYANDKPTVYIRWGYGVAYTGSAYPYSGWNIDDIAVTGDPSRAGFAVVPTYGLTTTEDGGTATFTVALNSQPTADVKFGLSSSDTSEGTVLPASLTFTSNNWATPQTVTVKGVDDTIIDGNVAYAILTAAASSADHNYNGLNPPDVWLTNLDNDARGLTCTLAPASISEGSGAAAAVGTVTRNVVTAEPLVVTLNSSDTSEATVPNSVTIPANQASATFDIAAVDDTVIDGTQTVTITAKSLVGDAVAGLDSTFGSGGLAATSLSMSSQPPHNAMTLQGDGKILTASESIAGDSAWRITRLQSDGSIDTGFGTNGIVDTTFSTQRPVPYKIVVQPDGKFLVGGKFVSTAGIALARYNSNGSLDASFGVGGIASFSGLAAEWIEDMVQQPDGKTLLALGINGTVYTRVARINADGSLDMDFASGGVQTFSNVNVNPRAIALLDDGRFILSGDSGNNSKIIRASADGSIDTTFGIGGVQTVNFGKSNTHIGDIAIDNAGRIVLGGYASDSNNTADFAAARLNPNGGFDDSFGLHGIVTVNFPAGLDDVALSMILQNDDKIVLSGYSETSDGVNQVALARLKVDGTLDTGFGKDGYLTASITSFVARRATSSILQPDGSLLILAGWNSDWRVAKFTMGAIPVSTTAILKVTDNDNLPTTIGDLVWNDLNSNGIQDAGEPGIAGTGVELYSSADAVVGNADDLLVAQTVTDAQGKYAFSDLVPGVNYYLVYRPPIGYSFAPKDAAGGTDANDSDADAAGVTDLFTVTLYQTDNTHDAGLVGAPPAFGYAMRTGTMFSYDGNGSLATDATGNLYITGSFQGSYDFDPGPASVVLTSSGFDDIYVAKYSPAGALLWARCIGGANSDVGTDIAVASDGSVLVTGTFSGTVDFDSGPNTVNLTASHNDTFILKLDAGGNFVWVRDLAGSSYVTAQAIALATDGSIFVTGFFNGSADFDPGSGTYNLNASGNYDAFVLKLKSAGSFAWACHLGSINSYSYGTDIAAAPDGGVYIVGNFRGTMDFDPGTAVYNLTPTGYTDAFVWKLGSTGEFVRAQRLGGTSVQYDTVTASAIAVAGDGSIVITGGFQGTVDFDPGAGSYQLVNLGASTAYAWKLNANGAFVWARAIAGYLGAYCASEGRGITVDSQGSAYLTGFFLGRNDFDPGSDTCDMIASTSYPDVFVSKLDATGAFVWARAMGGPFGDDRAFDISVAADGGIYTKGAYSVGADFDPGPGIYPLPDSGAFVSKLLPDHAPTDISLSGGTLAENQPVGTVVGGFSSTDPDPSEAFTYSLVPGSGGDDNALFAVNSVGQLVTAAILDFETKAAYGIRVRTTDSSGMRFEKTFIITVTDAPETFLVGAENWTASGLTVTLGSDGKLHAYRTGTTIDVVPPHVFANVTGIKITGRAGADDELTVDFGPGNPLPAGGMIFDGNSQLSGDTLLIKGTAGDDNATLSGTQIILDGKPAIAYTGVEFFGFNLGAGEDNLLVDHATLRLNRNNAFSANTNVTVDGGLLDFNGKTTPLGDLVVKNNGQVRAASLVNQNITVDSSTLTAGSIICDSLIIGSQFVVFTATASDWTDAGLTLKLDGDGIWHFYRSGTTIDAVPPRPASQVTDIEVTGRSSDDVLSIDPIAVGLRSLSIKNATLIIDRDNAISPGTKVIIDGGKLDVGRTTVFSNYLVMINGAQAVASEIRDKTIKVESGTLTAGSIVCDTLTIGSQQKSSALVERANVQKSAISNSAATPSIDNKTVLTTVADNRQKDFARRREDEAPAEPRATSQLSELSLVRSLLRFSAATTAIAAPTVTQRISPILERTDLSPLIDSCLVNGTRPTDERLEYPTTMPEHRMIHNANTDQEEISLVIKNHLDRVLERFWGEAQKEPTPFARIDNPPVNAAALSQSRHLAALQSVVEDYRDWHYADQIDIVFRHPTRQLISIDSFPRAVDEILAERFVR